MASQQNKEAHGEGFDAVIFPHASERTKDEAAVLTTVNIWHVPAARILSQRHAKVPMSLVDAETILNPFHVLSYSQRWRWWKCPAARFSMMNMEAGNCDVVFDSNDMIDVRSEFGTGDIGVSEWAFNCFLYVAFAKCVPVISVPVCEVFDEEEEAGHVQFELLIEAGWRPICPFPVSGKMIKHNNWLRPIEKRSENCCLSKQPRSGIYEFMNGMDVGPFALLEYQKRQCFSYSYTTAQILKGPSVSLDHQRFYQTEQQIKNLKINMGCYD